MPGLAPLIVTLVATFGLLAATTTSSHADGYNTWPGGLVTWGDLEMSPQFEVALPTQGEWNLPWMLQGGLSQNVDLAVGFGVDMQPDGAQLQPMYVVPRMAVGEHFAVGLGAVWTLAAEGITEPGLLTAFTWAWEPGGPWRGDGNLFATLKPAGDGKLTIDLVMHVERHLTGVFSGLLEVDLQGTFAFDLRDPTAIAYAGMFIKPQRCDMVAFAVGVPLAGSQGDRRPIVGAWWNHVIDLGFGERNCRR